MTDPQLKIKPFPRSTREEWGDGWKLSQQELAYIAGHHSGECNEEISEESIEWIILYLQGAGYMTPHTPIPVANAEDWNTHDHCERLRESSSANDKMTNSAPQKS